MNIEIPANPDNHQLKWVKRWQSVTQLTLGPRLVGEIYQFNGGWYASAMTRRREGDEDVLASVRLCGPVIYSYAVQVCEEHAKKAIASSATLPPGTTTPTAAAK
jgi:hypothetical protein